MVNTLPTCSISQHLKTHLCPSAKKEKNSLKTPHITQRKKQKTKQKLGILEALSIKINKPSLNFEESSHV